MSFCLSIFWNYLFKELSINDFCGSYTIDG